MSKKVTYKQKYRKCWENDPLFSKWLRSTEFDDRAYCAFCKCDLGSKYVALLKHLQTRKHIRAAERTPMEQQERRFDDSNDSMPENVDKPVKTFNFKPKKCTIKKPKKESESTEFIVEALHEEEEVVKNNDVAINIQKETHNPLYPMHEELCHINDFIPVKKEQKFAWLGDEVVYEINLIKSEEIQRQASWSIQAILKKYILKDKAMRHSNQDTQT